MIVSKSVLSSRLENDVMFHWRLCGVHLNPEIQRSVIDQVEKKLRLIGLQLRKLTTTKNYILIRDLLNSLRLHKSSFSTIKTTE